MANQTIPITLSWGAVAAQLSALNINQLGALIAQQLSASMRADVTFILNVLQDPGTFQTTLIYNQTQGVIKAWNEDVGAYVPLTQFIVGDTMGTFNGNDQVAVGWVILNGRAINAIPGLTTAQQTVLEGFFGVDGNIPNIVPANINNLPAADSFSGITVPTVLPADGVIGGLPIGVGYDQGEVEDLRDATETLRDSTAEVETQVATIQEKCGDLLTALRVPVSPPQYTKMFVGYM